jgi:hypothetical protein
MVVLHCLEVEVGEVVWLLLVAVLKFVNRYLQRKKTSHDTNICAETFVEKSFPSLSMNAE